MMLSKSMAYLIAYYSDVIIPDSSKQEQWLADHLSQLYSPMDFTAYIKSVEDGTRPARRKDDEYILAVSYFLTQSEVGRASLELERREFGEAGK